MTSCDDYTLCELVCTPHRQVERLCMAVADDGITNNGDCEWAVVFAGSVWYWMHRNLFLRFTKRPPYPLICMPTRNLKELQVCIY